MKRKFKIGERVFCKCYDGQIKSGIITGIKDSTYTNENGKEIPFKMLSIGKYGMIEDYNILPKNNKEVVELKHKYKIVDKIIKKIKTIVQLHDNETKKYIIESLEGI